MGVSHFVMQAKSNMSINYYNDNDTIILIVCHTQYYTLKR